MKILYLDCGMGAAGDMLQGALVSLLSKEGQESFITKINNAGIDGVKVSLTDDVKCGITGKHIHVSINGEEEKSEDVHSEYQHDDHNHHHEDHHHDGHDHLHEDHHHHDEHNHYHEANQHDHHHEEHHHDDHVHHHTSLADISHMVEKLNVSDRVKEDVLAIYGIIASAESRVHGRDVSLVHFHEVGMKDALADILGTAMLMEELSVDKVIVSPINVGYGKVKCAHGILPVPAPATAEILKGIPTYSGRFEGEMCTPTGAAILKYYANEFSYQPLLSLENCGYGCGNKEFEAANLVKAVLGDSLENISIMDSDHSNEKPTCLSDSITELRCNLDDMSGEDLAYAVDILLKDGAKDAFVTPVIMKKGRSGFLLTVLCDSSDKQKMAELIFKNTSTIGIREYSVNRMILDRRTIKTDTEFGPVRIKESTGYGVKRLKPEFEDIKRLADEQGIPIDKVRKIIEKRIGFTDEEQ